MNVYYGPAWPITPCRVKHFVRIKSLKSLHGARDLTVDLAVVEVFMSSERLPYIDDAAAASIAASERAQPTEDDIITFVVE